MADLRNMFESFEQLDSYKRIDSTHPLDLYIGQDELSRWTLLLITEIRPANIVPSKMIATSVGVRKDKRWALTFSLIDDTYMDMFLLFFC